MHGLTNLRANGQSLGPPKLNRRRALFVLAKIEVILAWEQSMERERDTRFVELGRYLCEVRTGQYWRLDNLSCFDCATWLHKAHSLPKEKFKREVERIDHTGREQPGELCVEFPGSQSRRAHLIQHGKRNESVGTDRHLA